MGRLLGDIKTTDIIARRADLAVAQECLVDSTVMPGYPQVINRGELLAKYQPSDASVHVGKFRPYAESQVTSAFATGSKAFTLDPTVRASQWFQPGDVITAADATALGTIATYDPATGVGTLVANSSNNLADDQTVILSASNWAINNKQGLILQDETLVNESGDDVPVSAFREGFFVKSRTSLTSAAITALGAVEETSDEVRIQ